MTLRRALDRLEGLTPARKADEETRELLPRALRAAAHGIPGGMSRVMGTLEWQDCIAPFPVHMTQTAIQNEMTRRLGVLLPVLRDLGGDEGVKVFLAALGARAGEGEG